MLFFMLSNSGAGMVIVVYFLFSFSDAAELNSKKGGKKSEDSTIVKKLRALGYM